MKSYNRLFEKIVSFDNMLLAARKAERGKRARPDVCAFDFNLEKELVDLKDELKSAAYRPGPYRCFTVHEPKERFISVVPFRDRVVHHAICNVVVPLLERSFIYDTYANRVGKGMHQALVRFRQFVQRYRYVLKCDIKKYFATIDHDILLGKLERRIRCRRTMELLRRIVESSPPQESIVQYFPGDDLWTPMDRRKGIPLGNLTSQFFANFYLNDFDHYVKERLRVKPYVRYVDDFSIFGHEKDQLWAAYSHCRGFMENERLRLHPRKTRIYRTDEGTEFVGFRVFPDRIRIRREGVLRFARRLRRQQRLYTEGRIGQEEIKRSLVAWLGHAGHANARRLCGDVLMQTRFVKVRS
ncbi:MAG: reverse transcriptase domain-containing protein [Planctomycetota bacterium]